MTEEATRPELAKALGIVASELLGHAPISAASVGADALEKTEALLDMLSVSDDSRLSLLSETAKTARQTNVVDSAEAPAIGLGRLVVAEDHGPVNLLLHPGVPAPSAAHIGRWVEELGLMGLLFREKSPEIDVRTQLLIRILDRWTEPHPELVTRNTLLALGAHIYRRLHGPRSPQGTIAAMLDFAEVLLDQPASIGLPWRSAT